MTWELYRKETGVVASYGSWWYCLQRLVWYARSFGILLRIRRST